MLTDSSGNVVSRRDFLPFGEELYADGQHRTTAGKYSITGQDSVRERFTGYEKDQETGLDFAENRMYGNTFGRFTAVDPLLASGKSANPQTFNRYSYVLNNPALYVDPDGLQTGFAGGKVYQRGNNYAIFAGKPLDGYRAVTRTIHTQTTIRGVQHHLTVTPRGWTVGDRVDNVKSAPPPTASMPARPPVENFLIRQLSTGISNGVYDGTVGIAKGIGNAPNVALNGATTLALNSGPGMFYFQGSNPLAVPMTFNYTNARQASYGSAGSTGFLAGLGFGAGAFSGGGSTLSVVPETQLFRFSQTSASSNFSAGGSFAGRSVMEVAGDLRTGAMSPSEVPVDFVQRGSFNLIDNTRSSIALQEAGIPMNQWTLVNRTGNFRVETAVSDKLFNNGLTSTGTNTVRMGGCTFLCR